MGQRGGQNRIQIIELLKERPYNLNQLAEILNVNYRTVRHHVNVLLKNDLVTTSHTGGYGDIYYLTPEMEKNLIFFNELVGKIKNFHKLTNFTNSPTFFENVMENTNEAVVIVNTDWEIFFWNKSATKLYGYTKNRMLGNTLGIFPDIEIKDNLIKKIKKRKKVISEEIQVKHKSGKLIDVDITIDSILDENGKLIGYSLFARNISEHKNTQELLRKTEKGYKYLYEESQAIKIIIDIDKKIMDVNRSMLKNLGYRKKDVIGKNVMDIIPSEQGIEVKKIIQDTIYGKYTGVLDVDVSAHDGSIHTIMFSFGKVTSHKGGKLDGIIFSGIDITDRKLVEEELDVEKKILKGVMENTDAMLAYLDTDFNFIYVNEAYADNAGFSVRNLIGKNHFTVFPNKENNAIFKRVRETGKFVKYIDREFEFPNQPERGTTYWNWTLAPVKDNREKVIGLVLSLTETTKRVLAEESIKQSKEKFEDLLKNIPVAVYSALPDDQATTVFMSKQYADWTGYGIEEFYNDPKIWINTIHPDDRDRIIKEFTKARKQGRGYLLEYRTVNKDTGEIYYLIDQGKPIKDEKGKIRVYDGIVSNVTNLKRRDTEIKQLAEVMADSNDAITVLDLDGSILDWNKGAERMYGYSKKEALKMNINKMVPEDRMEEVFELINEVKKGNNIKSLETLRITKTGGIKDIWLTITKLLDENNNLKAIATTERDITDRKLAQEKLRQARDYAEDIVETLSDPLLVLDNDMRVISANKSFYNFFKEKPRNVNGRYIFNLGSGQWNNLKLQILLNEIIPKKTIVEDFEVEHDFPLIGHRIMLINAQLLYQHEQDKIQSRLLLTFKDITAWRRAEEQIKFQANILSQINDAVIVIDNDQQIIYWNRGAERLYGWRENEIIGKKLTDAFQYQWLNVGGRKDAQEELSKAGTWRGKTSHVTKNGKKVQVESMVTRMMDENGRKTGFLAVMRDISK